MGFLQGKRPVKPPVNLEMAEALCDFHGGMGNGIGIEKAGVGTTGGGLEGKRTDAEGILCTRGGWVFELSLLGIACTP